MTDPIPTLTRHEAYGVEEFDPGKPLMVRTTVFAIGLFCFCSLVSWWGG